MKEIKFRFWNKEKEIMCFDNEDDSSSYWDGVDCSVVKLINNELNSEWTRKEYDIMQYSGIKDKNEKEIYEGDIIEIKVYDSFSNQCISTKKCVMEFKNGIFGVMFTKAQELTAFVHFTNTTFEVIGNIYENKELLSEVENWK